MKKIPNHLKEYIVEQDYSKYTYIDQACWRFIMRINKSYFCKVVAEAIFSLERQANRVYMTDPTFMKYRVPFGLFLLVSGAFMIYSTIGYF